MESAVESVRNSISKDRDLSAELGQAIEDGSLKRVDLLLRRGADVNLRVPTQSQRLQDQMSGSYPLLVASEVLHFGIVKRLIEAGADVNAQSPGDVSSALIAASSAYRDQRGPPVVIVETLIKAGAHVNAQGGKYGNALQAACARNLEAKRVESFWNYTDSCVLLVKRLIEAGANVNAQGGEYGNALYAASCAKEPSIVSSLLEAGADVNAQGGEQGNALNAACYSGCLWTVKLLIEAGADVNAQGGGYGNALYAASCVKEPGIFSSLLEAGADINARGGKQGSALNAACYMVVFWQSRDSSERAQMSTHMAAITAAL